MRVLVADKFEQSGLDGLTALRCEVSCEPGLKDQALAARVGEFKPDVLIVRSTKVGEPVLAAGALKLVVRAGAGYNTIDLAAASRRGIYVSNCPGKNSIAVAELAFALILALDRRIADNVISLRAGEWDKAEFSKARGLFGRTLGLLGVGSIGSQMIPRAKAFGMRVVAWSRSLSAARAEALGIERKDSPREIVSTADIVSVHLALGPETCGLCDAGFFAAMRKGAYFINTARGEIVDEEALKAAIREKGIRAGLDVFAQEPAGATGNFTSEIAQMPATYGTHHIGASTEQAQEAIAAEAVRIVRVFQETGKAPNVVNLARKTPATCTLVVRHLDRPGVLASVLDAIGAAKINVQEMENVVFEGAEAAVARVNLETIPPEATLQLVRTANPDILELSLIRL
jgi:D-3-phosphoglycerate dehydrogenase